MTTEREFKVQLAFPTAEDMPAWVTSAIADAADRLGAGDYTVDRISITATCTAVTR